MNDNSLAERLVMLRDRYVLLACPLLLLIGVGGAKAPVLSVTAAVLLVGLTLNKVIPLLR